MQEKFTLINDTPIGNSKVALVEEEVISISDVSDVADMVSGYGECMAEAVRYLTEVEKYPYHHPAVKALMSHLSESRKNLLAKALFHVAGSSSL